MVNDVSDWPNVSIEDTEEQRAQAKKISDEIDDAIQRERRAKEEKRPPRKVLLLGPSQSGKSTLLKNFHLLFAPKSFHAEAEAWRAVIHLNLAQSVNFILDNLSTPNTISPGNKLFLRQDAGPDVGQLRIRLSPLRQVEISLNQCLTVEHEATPRRPISLYNNILRTEGTSKSSIRGGSAWKALAKSQTLHSSIKSELQKTRSILDACRDDIVSLWSDPAVREQLKKQGTTLEDSSVFFLDNAFRVAARDYIPTADDILRARLETIGVEEHRIVMETADAGEEWIFYDIEGSRGQRASWVPYFDDVHAIIFLVSMADFDQSLPDDPQVNRFADSFTLWKTVCENKLIAQTPVMLLLNKADLLQEKLSAGIFFAQFVKEFGDQPNDLKSVSKYFKTLFMAAHDIHSPKERRLFVQTTCAIDTQAMSLVLREGSHPCGHVERQHDIKFGSSASLIISYLTHLTVLL
ncbi:unnamed protein product [Somion occarium]|uniref:G-alpha-domain-containing protein n=1 Tax=Somion occarium TaxID=3059160 RepID=A0ABP1DIL9_9APHY